MKRFGAWFLFVLACVLPGWYLRDIVAAEAQVRTDEPPFPHHEFIRGYPIWRPSQRRKLGPRGAQVLWRELRERPDATRRDRAFRALIGYDNRTGGALFVDALLHSDPYLHRWANEWLVANWSLSGPHGCLDVLSREELLFILRNRSKLIVPSIIIWTKYQTDPVTAQSAAEQWARETADKCDVFNVCQEMVSGESRETWFYTGAWGAGSRRAIKAMAEAGLKNPNASMRECWLERLKVVESELGRR